MDHIHSSSLLLYHKNHVALVILQYTNITTLMRRKIICSAYVIGAKGIAEAISKMAFGNKLGVKLHNDRENSIWFLPDPGSIIVEMTKQDLAVLDEMGLDYVQRRILKLVVRRFH